MISVHAKENVSNAASHGDNVLVDLTVSKIEISVASNVHVKFARDNNYFVRV